MVRKCVSKFNLGTLHSLLSTSGSHWAFIMSPHSFVHSFSWTYFLFCAILPISLIEAVSISYSGQSVTLNDIPYFISPYSAGRLSLDGVSLAGCVSAGGLYPVMVLDSSVNASDISALVQSYTAQDDVFQPAFMQSTSNELKAEVPSQFTTACSFAHFSHCQKIA